MTPILLSGPTEEPVSIAQARQWLKIDTSDEDDLIGGLITSARLMIEATTRRMLMTQSWRLLLDQWPRGIVYQLPLAPVLSVNGVRLIDALGNPHPLPELLYWLQASSEKPRLIFNTAPPSPERAAGGIEIDVTVGYGPRRDDVPAPLRQAICMLTAAWFEDRGDTLSDASREPLPPRVAALVMPYRRTRLA